MRRKSKDNVPGYIRYFRKEFVKGVETKKTLTKNQFAGIGAIAIAWNYIDGGIDTALAVALQLRHPVWIEVTSRINGFDGKIAIIKQAARTVFQMPDEQYNVLTESLGAIELHKRYRDGVIHAQVLFPDTPVADTTRQRGKFDEVLITEPALDALFSRIIALQRETDDIALIFHLLYVYDRPKSDSDIQRVEQELPACLTRLQERQKHRQSLPPLPEFPEGPAVPPMSELPKWPLG